MYYRISYYHHYGMLFDRFYLYGIINSGYIILYTAHRILTGKFFIFSFLFLDVAFSV